VQNSIGDAGLVAIADALSRHGRGLGCLRELRLSFNSYGAPGLRALAKCLSHRARLPALKLLKVSQQHEQLKKVCRARKIELAYEGSRARLLASKDSHSGDLKLFGTESDAGLNPSEASEGQRGAAAFLAAGAGANEDVTEEGAPPPLEALRGGPSSTSSSQVVGSHTFSRLFFGRGGSSTTSSSTSTSLFDFTQRPRLTVENEQSVGGASQAAAREPPRRVVNYSVGDGGTTSLDA
jgi:hypothetical protein